MRILFEYFIYRCCMQITNFNALKILFISNGIFVFADRLLGPLYAIFVEKFDTNILSVSFSWFIFMLSATLFTLIISKYGDYTMLWHYMDTITRRLNLVRMNFPDMMERISMALSLTSRGQKEG